MNRENYLQTVLGIKVYVLPINGADYVTLNDAKKLLRVSETQFVTLMRHHKIILRTLDTTKNIQVVLLSSIIQYIATTKKPDVMYPEMNLLDLVLRGIYNQFDEKAVIELKRIVRKELFDYFKDIK